MTGLPFLPAGPVSPVLDGRTPIFIELGADPRVAPGFQAPPGSIAAFGSVYLWKVGDAATEWTLLNESNFLNGELIDAITATGSGDATLDVSGSGADLIAIEGTLVASGAANMNVLWNGAAASDESGLQFFPAGGFGTTTVVGGASAEGGAFRALAQVSATPNKALWSYGTFDFGAAVRGLRWGYSFYDPPGAVTSVTFRLAGLNTWAGARFTARRVQL